MIRGGFASVCRGASSRARSLNRCPQSWQNLNSPGLSRPQRPHLTVRGDPGRVDESSPACISSPGSWGQGERLAKTALPPRQGFTQLPGNLQGDEVRQPETDEPFGPDLFGAVGPPLDHKNSVEQSRADHGRSSDLVF